MKISEMTMDQAADAMIRLSGPFESICNDDELIEAFNELPRMGHEPAIKTVGKMLPVFVRVGIRKHRHDLYEIIGALTMTPVSKIGQLNFKETVSTLQDSYDEILRDFFSRTATARRIGAKK